MKKLVKSTNNILKERYEKKIGEYEELQGKPKPKTKEQRSKEIQKKLEKLKHHKVSDPLMVKKGRTMMSLICFIYSLSDLYV